MINQRSLSYGDLERFLAFRHHANFEQMRGALRGRMKHLQKLGFPLETSGAGKGQRVRYAPCVVGKIAVAFELMACGVAPADVVALVESHWLLIARAFAEAHPDFLALRCEFDFLAYRSGTRWRVHLVDSVRVQPGTRRVTFVDLLSVRRDLDAFMETEGAR